MNKETGAIGGSSRLGAQQAGNVTHGVMAEQIIKELQAATQAAPGTEFIVIQKVRQGEDPRVWSTGDTEQTQQLFRDAYTSLAYDRQHERAG